MSILDDAAIAAAERAHAPNPCTADLLTGAALSALLVQVAGDVDGQAAA